MPFAASLERLDRNDVYIVKTPIDTVCNLAGLSQSLEDQFYLPAQRKLRR
ncbi:MAG TPA: hypothetical protein VJW17_01015 [Pyrinomonadaceae bacterium]|nr:hypothetical protein [Pyrinomonadaceae bacterium]